MGAALRFVGLISFLLLSFAEAENNNPPHAAQGTLLDDYLESIDRVFGRTAPLVKKQRTALLQRTGPYLRTRTIFESYIQILDDCANSSDKEIAGKAPHFIANTTELFGRLVTEADDVITAMRKIGEPLGLWKPLHIVFFLAHRDLFTVPMRQTADWGIAVFSPETFPSSDEENLKDATNKRSLFLMHVPNQGVELTHLALFQKHLHTIKGAVGHRGAQPPDPLTAAGFAYAAGKHARKLRMEDADILIAAETLRSGPIQPVDTVSIPISFESQSYTGHHELYRVSSEDILWAVFLYGAAPTGPDEERKNWAKIAFSHLQGAKYGGASTTLGLIARVDPLPLTQVPGVVSWLVRPQIFEALNWKSPRLFNAPDSELNHLVIEAAQHATLFDLPFGDIAPAEDHPEDWENLISNVDALGLSWEEVRAVLKERLDCATDAYTFRALAKAASGDRTIDLVHAAALANHGALASHLPIDEWWSLAGTSLFDIEAILRIENSGYFIGGLTRFLADDNAFLYPKDVEKHARAIAERTANSLSEVANLQELVRVVNERPLPQTRIALEHRLGEAPEWKTYLLWKIVGWQRATSGEEPWVDSLLKELSGGLLLHHLSAEQTITDILIDMFEGVLKGVYPDLPWHYEPLPVLAGLLSYLTVDNESAITRLDRIVAEAFAHKKLINDQRFLQIRYAAERAVAENQGELVLWTPLTPELAAEKRSLACRRKLLERLPLVSRWWPKKD